MIISPAWFPWVHPISPSIFSVFAAEVHALGYYAHLKREVAEMEKFFFFAFF